MAAPLGAERVLSAVAANQHPFFTQQISPISWHEFRAPISSFQFMRQTV